MKVSVIIPVYQVGNYVEDCLQSVRSQTLTDLEILCVDDCGTDGSMEKVREAAAEDGRIRLIENPRNLGLGASRNRGLAQAKGEYVYFLDADDKIDPGAMEALYLLAEKERLDAVAFCAAFLYEEESLRERFQGNPAVFKREYPEVMTGKELYKAWMTAWDWMPSQPRFFYRRAFLLENGIRFPEGMLHEDESFAFDVLMHAERMRAAGGKWFIRRFRKDSIMTRTPTMKNVEGCLQILQHIAAARGAYADDRKLCEAVDFYRKKIAANTRGKCAEALGVSGKESEFAFRAGEEEPDVSVLIPVYNVEPYLETCLNSVLAQTVLNLEVICVDDASTDRSAEILEKYAEMDPRIRILYNERNRGQAFSRNRAMELASGKYVYMLDADDWITPDAFAILKEQWESCAPDVIGFENRQFADDPSLEEAAAAPLFTYEQAEGLYSGKEAFIRCVEEDRISPSVPTFLIRRAYLEERHLRFEEGILHEDIGFIFEMLTGADRVLLLHKALFCRRFRLHSTVTEGFSVRHAEGYLKSWQKAFALKEELRGRYGEETAFWHAWRKWTRDVLGRIRVLYSTSDCGLYFAEESGDDPEISGLLAMLRETTSRRERALDILGEEVIREIEASGAVYLCGSGQYMNRFLDLAAALDVEILGVLESGGRICGKKTVRGFRVLDPADAEDRTAPVIMTVSRYQAERYKESLKEAGFTCLVTTRF